MVKWEIALGSKVAICSPCINEKNGEYRPYRCESRSITMFSVSIVYLQLNHLSFLYELAIHMFHHPIDVPIMRNTCLGSITSRSQR